MKKLKAGRRNRESNQFWQGSDRLKVYLTPLANTRDAFFNYSSQIEND